MTSVILQTATRGLMPLLLLFSVFLLFRGHNEPGGGFVGGLVAAGTFALYALAFSPMRTRVALRVDPRTVLAVGLAVAVVSSLLPFLARRPFFTGIWVDVPIPLLGEIALGTPLLFDIGVYLTVIGVTLSMILALAEV